MYDIHSGCLYICIANEQMYFSDFYINYYFPLLLLGVFISISFARFMFILVLLCRAVAMRTINFWPQWLAVRFVCPLARCGSKTSNTARLTFVRFPKTANDKNII